MKTTLKFAILLLSCCLVFSCCKREHEPDFPIPPVDNGNNGNGNGDNGNGNGNNSGNNNDNKTSRMRVASYHVIMGQHQTIKNEIFDWKGDFGFFASGGLVDFYYGEKGIIVAKSGEKLGTIKLHIYDDHKLSEDAESYLAEKIVTYEVIPRETSELFLNIASYELNIGGEVELRAVTGEGPFSINYNPDMLDVVEKHPGIWGIKALKKGKTRVFVKDRLKREKEAAINIW